MKKIILVFTSLLYLNSPSFAQFIDDCRWCDNYFYAEVLGGANFIQNLSHDGFKPHFKTGYIVSGALGYSFCYGVRAEFEYAYRRNVINKVEVDNVDFSAHGHFQSQSYMINFLFDLPLYAWWTHMWGLQPYLGGGVGYDFQKEIAHGDEIELHVKSNHFSWQVIAGFSYPIWYNTDISLQYKYHKGGFSYLGCHTAGLALTYRFDVF